MGKKIDPETKAEQVLVELREAIRQGHELLAGIKEFKRDFNNAVTTEWKEILEREIATLREGITVVDKELQKKYLEMDDHAVQAIVLKCAVPMMKALIEHVEKPIEDIIETALRKNTGLPFRIRFGPDSNVGSHRG